MKRVLIAILTYCCASIAHTQNPPTANILQRVFAIKNGDVMGTAFAVEFSNKQYLVTAKHVVPGTNTEMQIQVFHEEQWKALPVAIQRSDESDVAILSMSVQLASTMPVSLNGQHYLAQDVYFLGFPYFLHTDVGAPGGGFPIPFVKKGILSAWIKGSNRYATIYVDGHNNQGFSGGPMIVMNPGQQVVIIGVVSSYRVNPDPVINRELNTGMVSMANAGIIQCENIQYALDLLKTLNNGAELNADGK